MLEARDGDRSFEGVADDDEGSVLTLEAPFVARELIDKESSCYFWLCSFS